jgi:hypothetical protein
MVKETRICVICGEEKPITQYRNRGGLSGNIRRDCRTCNNAASVKRAAEKKAYIDECRARGDGYDVLENERTVPIEAKLLLRMILTAFRAARSRSSDNNSALRRKESLEWLLGFDVLRQDKDGISFGSCLNVLPAYGINLPSQEKIKAKVIELAHAAGFDIEWNAIDVNREEDDGELESLDTEGETGGETDHRRIAA